MVTIPGGLEVIWTPAFLPTKGMVQADRRVDERMSKIAFLIMSSLILPDVEKLRMVKYVCLGRMVKWKHCGLQNRDARVRFPLRPQNVGNKDL